MDPSSGRDRDPKSSTSDSESENPFVKFRRTVDSQVSSLLQGIIGLPSAFSKRGPDNRWADIDEDLRRRDQQQVRQEQLRRQLGEAETAESEKTAAEEHALADYLMLMEQQRKQRDSMTKAEQEQERSRNLLAEGAEDVEGEIPVKKSYQQRAPQTSDQLRPYWGSSASSKEIASSEEQNDPNIKDLPLYSPITTELFKHLQQSNSQIDSLNATQEPLQATRHLTLSFLKQSPLYHADYSLLPYLLFSPYSPLKLSADARVPDTRTRDQFPYCQAFEDLIGTTEAKNVGHQREDLIWSSWIRAPWKAGRTLYDNWSWITNLYFRGLLQQKESVPFTPVAWLSPMVVMATALNLDRHGGTETEVRLFEQLLGTMQGNPAEQRQWHLGLDAVFSSDLKFRGQSSGFSEMIEQARERAELDARQIRDSRESQVSSYKEERTQKMSGSTTENASESDRVVLTSTTTERTAHEDGSVGTFVTVWKQYGDGRETTTTTTHTEDPGRDGFDLRSAIREQHERDGKRLEKEFEEADKEEKKKSEKKGWFWN